MTAEQTVGNIPPAPRGDGTIIQGLLDRINPKGRAEQRLAREQALAAQKQANEEAKLAEAASPAKIEPMNMAARGNKAKAAAVRDNGYRYGDRKPAQPVTPRNPYRFDQPREPKSAEPQRVSDQAIRHNETTDWSAFPESGLTPDDVIIPKSSAREQSAKGFQSAHVAINGEKVRGSLAAHVAEARRRRRVRGARA